MGRPGVRGGDRGQPRNPVRLARLHARRPPRLLRGHLEDQVAALRALGARHRDLDLGRVGVRGWSYGGYLSALAVLRRPDVFHAASAGAAPTDFRHYDTAYTERYLGLPRDAPEVYERDSLLADAARLTRPLLLTTGLADDNVHPSHTLRLSRALTDAGRPHRLLALPGVTHMTPDGTREKVMALELEFFREVLAGGPAAR
ncbi:alpha/beta hydrolase family protein [Streptomyces sp. NPDC058655]|uniref:alpha/beta hydrolase family protein n=1 Tax=Streptomyces sp. NPDC058655 TaxID=3346577 RepID=UPI0036534409